MSNIRVGIGKLRYLKVEVEANLESKQITEMYSSVIMRLKQSLSNGNSSTRQTLATIAAQKVL
jgi:hypothetical protein